MRVIAFSVAMSAAMLVSCGDPVHDNAVKALGGETFGLSPGPTHRPGQPCLVCHGGSGPSKTQFAVAGTVFQTIDDINFLQGADVTLLDSQSNGTTVHTNATGNFYVEASRWTVAYPLHVKVTYKTVTAEMKTHVGRDGSCASCHNDPVTPTSVGHVYLVTDPADLPK